MHLAHDSSTSAKLMNGDESAKAAFIIMDANVCSGTLSNNFRYFRMRPSCYVGRPRCMAYYISVY